MQGVKTKTKIKQIHLIYYYIILLHALHNAFYTEIKNFTSFTDSSNSNSNSNGNHYDDCFYHHSYYNSTRISHPKQSTIHTSHENIGKTARQVSLVINHHTFI
jgi:hypothetical protein